VNHVVAVCVRQCRADLLYDRPRPGQRHTATQLFIEHGRQRLALQILHQHVHAGRIGVERIHAHDVRVTQCTRATHLLAKQPHRFGVGTNLGSQHLDREQFAVVLLIDGEENHAHATFAQ
jgi:hypothetical protein